MSTNSQYLPAPVPGEGEAASSLNCQVDPRSYMVSFDQDGSMVISFDMNWLFTLERCSPGEGCVPEHKQIWEMTEPEQDLLFGTARRDYEKRMAAQYPLTPSEAYPMVKPLEQLSYEDLKDKFFEDYKNEKLNERPE